MAEHKYKMDHFPYDQTYVSLRQDLVRDMIKLLLEERLIAIRAPPMTGKSTLLSLIGQEILREHPSLEPIQMMWEIPEKRLEKDYREYLASNRKLYVKFNEAERQRLKQPSTDKRYNVYLIDEATNTYEDPRLWNDHFKNAKPSNNDYFVLIFVYGSTDLYYQWGRTDSESSTFHAKKRIELVPNHPGGPQLLLSPAEIKEATDQWPRDQPHARHDDDIYEFFEYQTNGHAGMLGHLLTFLKKEAKADKLSHAQRTNLFWDPKLCYRLLGDESLTNFLPELQSERGCWTKTKQGRIAEHLEKEKIQGPNNKILTIHDIQKALDDVADCPDGYADSNPNPIMECCHKLGLLHSYKADGNVTYIFPSPIHRRLAYWRTHPGAGLDAKPDKRTLREVCIAVLGRFSHNALQPRREQSGSQWQFPEAQFHAEMYSCIRKELHGLPILSELSPDSRGRIDLYIIFQRWGIELIQNGTVASILEASSRFGPRGRYSRWGILDDYVIINFCSKETYQDLTSTKLRQNCDLFERTVQVVYEHQDRQMEMFHANNTREAFFDLDGRGH